MKLITTLVPEYKIDKKPSFSAIGHKVDKSIIDNFNGQKIVVRGICSGRHSGLSVKELIAKIIATGTDRYDPNVEGDRYVNVGNKHIDFFGFRRLVSPKSQIFKDICWGFYHGAIAIHGKPERIDLLLVYDSSLLKAVLHQYQSSKDKKLDGFVFRNQDRKKDALLGIIHIL